MPIGLIGDYSPLLSSAIFAAVEPQQLTASFEQTFGKGVTPRVVRSPGRVNLIGEHTDYNDGFVCPMAIEPCVLLAYRPRNDSTVKVGSTHFPGQFVEFDLAKPIEPVQPPSNWANYVRGIAAQLLAAGHKLRGVDVLMANTLPAGSGLSSSAAVEVGVGRVLLDAAGAQMGSPELALAAQKAEHTFPQVKCGIMDQMIVANGKVGHAMLLDCRSLERTYIPVSAEDLRVVITNSMHAHTLAGHEDSLTLPNGSVHHGVPYNMRRLACETGVAAINRPGVTALRDATMPMLDAVKDHLTDLIYRRCRHVITENDRCQAFGPLLRAGDYAAAGKLMVESHRSLQHDYEVSVDALDFLVDEAMQIDGVYGSRMTGAGFGGCTVSFVRPDAAEAFTRKITRAYEGKFSKTPQVIVTTATDGARAL